MQLTFKLYASLTEFLPDNAEDHAVTLEISEQETPHSIIDHHNVPRESAHLILLNGVYVTPDQRDEAIFTDGDTLAIWPPVAGG